MRSPRLILPLLLVLWVPFVQAQAPLTYPETRRVEHVDTYHGVPVADPYRWLEDLDETETQAWIEAQDALTRSVLNNVPERPALLNRLRAIQPHQTYSAAQKRGDRYFFVRTFRDDAEAIRRVLYVQDGPNGTPRTLIDVTQAFSAEARFATYLSLGEPSFQVSPDGRYVAYGVTEGNDRWSRWYVHDVETGRDLSDEILGINTSVFTTIWWHPQDNGFFYAAYEPPDDASAQGRPAGPQRLYYHRLGTPQADDTLVFDQPAHPDWTYWAWVSEHYIVFRGTDGSRAAIYYKDLRRPSAGVQSLFEATEATYSFVGQDDEHLWFRTTMDAPKGRLVAIDPGQPDPAHWIDVLPEDTSALISVDVFGGRLLAEYRIDARPVFKLFDTAGRFEREVEMPYIGWMQSGFVGRPDDPVVSFTIQNAIDPGSLYLLDVRTGQTTVFKQFTDTFDPDAYVTKQVFYTSKDGTRVPMFLTYRKGLDRNDRHPTWLYAYGFNWSALPWYQSQHRLWVDLGGVYALANVRGGSEYGQAWVEAGAGVHRQNAIDDFIAASAWLVEQGYTTTDLLVANGGSSSGPLAGAALAQRPDLFGAALLDYPYLDMLRYETYRSSRSIFGSVADLDEFQALRAWSPYHNLEAGTCYPPTLIAHGNEDQLALPLHSYKFTAALQAAQGCANPVLLQIAWDQGHTVGGPEEKANQLAFLVHVLGLDVPTSWNRPPMN